MTKSDILMLCKLQEAHAFIEGMKADNEKCRIRKEPPMWVLDDFIEIFEALNERTREYENEKPPQCFFTRIFSKLF